MGKNKNRNRNMTAKDSIPVKASKSSKVRDHSLHVTKKDKISTSVYTLSSDSSRASKRDGLHSAIDNQKGNSKLSKLQQQFAKKLEGARFRTINETLYTTTGTEAFESFQRDPHQFEVYHTGFREQASSWPYNPLDGIIEWLKKKKSKNVVADMGCGDARLAVEVGGQHVVHSFDLVSTNQRVTACNIANVPLANSSVDVVVFCLALMGTDISDFIREAYRVLKPNGALRIAEVRSRFDGEGMSIKKFTKFLKRAGFDVMPHDSTALNKMFFELECTKSDRPSMIAPEFSALPCVYKKR